MKINQQVIDSIEKAGIPVKDGLSYLLSVYFSCVASTVTSALVKKMAFTGIFSVIKGEIWWHINLFEEAESSKTVEKWDWVTTEYRKMFESVNPKRSGPKSSALAKMKKFFSENPDTRKEEVIGATKMYIRNLSDAQYITSAHYFISKGTGVNKISGLEDWVDKYKSYLSTSTNTDDITKSMQ